ncbi:unnamed protein product [Caenorhabditis brenneri]
MDNATEILLHARTSFLYRGNAMFQIAVAFSTLLVSVQALKLLYRRSVFHKSTRQLLFMSVVYADLHALGYGGLQAWSLYRSVSYATDPEHIVFSGAECYPVTWIVGFAKMLMIFIQFSLTIERVYSIVSSSKHFRCQGVLLNLLAVLAAIGMNTYSYSEGPSHKFKLQSCFMQRDIPLDRVLYALGVYLVLAAVCFLLNTIIIIGLRRSTKKSFNLKVRFNIQEVKNSSLAVCIISVAQFIAMLVYVLSSYGLILSKLGIPAEYFHNVILCVYTIPYAGLFLPVSIMYCVRWISEHRKIRITEMTTTNRTENLDSRMAQLKNAWDEAAPKY